MIIDHLHIDFPSLEFCCLVCNSWVNPRRYHLFKSTCFDSSEHLWRWRQTFSSSGPSAFVKDLYLHYYVCTSDGLESFIDILHSFVHVRYLCIVGFDPEWFRNESLQTYFGHFTPALRSLSCISQSRTLQTCSISSVHSRISTTWRNGRDLVEPGARFPYQNGYPGFAGGWSLGCYRVWSCCSLTSQFFPSISARHTPTGGYRGDCQIPVHLHSDPWDWIMRGFFIRKHVPS
jgi:hypothetical protein